MPYPNPAHGQAAGELQAQLEAERAGAPFIVVRRPGGEQLVLALADRERCTIGRGDGVDVDLEGDPEISRLHAVLSRLGDVWVLEDDGLSTNGSFVNGERIARRRLADGDLMLTGGTGILFRDPQAGERAGTVASVDTTAARSLSPTQRDVLVELCRPFAGGDAFAVPATNPEIGERLHLSVDAVKGHLRVLFDKFGLTELPQNQKRTKLAEAALRSGAVRPADLG